MQVTAYFDYGSPYAYLAWQRVRHFPDPYAGHTVAWEPVSAGHIFAADGTKPNVLHPNQKRYLLADVERWAEAYGVPWNEPPGMPINAIGAMRLHFRAEEQGLRDAWMKAVFEGYFRDGVDVSDPDALMRLADHAGLDVAEVDLQDPELKRRLVENTTQAYEAGCCGVPFLVLDGEPFWGNDRLFWLEARLAGREPDVGVAKAVAHGVR